MSQSVKKVHKLFNRPITLIAAVKNFHFSGIGKWSMKDNLHTCAIHNSRDKRQILSGWCLLSKRDRTCFSKCHMTKRHVILRSSAYNSQKGRPLCLVPQQEHNFEKWCQTWVSWRQPSMPILSFGRLFSEHRSFHLLTLSAETLCFYKSLQYCGKGPISFGAT